MVGIWVMIVTSTVVKLLGALAPFAWPALMATIFFYNRKQLRDLIGEVGNSFRRLIQAKFSGVHLELAGVADALQSAKDVDLPKDIVGEGAGTFGRMTMTASGDVQDQDAVIESSHTEATEILDLASKDYFLAIATLSLKLEAAARQALELKVPKDGKPYAGPRQLSSKLADLGHVDLGYAYRTFFDVRNKIIHSDSWSKREINETILVGLRLLDALKELGSNQTR